MLTILNIMSLISTGAWLITKSKILVIIALGLNIGKIGYVAYDIYGFYKDSD